MKWYWIVALVLLGLGLLVVLAGACLPVKHQCACRILLRQPAAAVFAAITDISQFTRWRPDLKAVEPLPDQDGRRCWREASGFGPIDLRVEERIPDRRLVTRIVTKGSPFGGTWTFRMEPRGADTELTITENGEVYNVVFRALSRFVFGHSATLTTYLKALAAKFGEVATVEPGTPDPEPLRT
jgi:uncharacterized protein YndB with AHSA1/START domain